MKTDYVQSFQAHNRRQQGLSIIELLVGVLLTSFLALSLTQIFTGNVLSSNIARNLGYSTEGGGYGSLLLVKYLRMGGYTDYFNVNTANNGEAVSAVYLGTDGSQDGTQNDIVAIEYEAPVRSSSNIGTTDKYTTCAGIEVNPSAIVRETFSVNTASKLTCMSEVISGDNQPAQTEILAAGVAGFQVQYGISANTESPDIVRYVTANFLGANGGDAEDLVRAIRFSILVRSDEALASGLNNQAQQVFTLLDEDIPVPGNASYRVYQTTVALNNAVKSRMRR